MVGAVRSDNAGNAKPVPQIAYRIPRSAYRIPWRARALFKLAYAIALVQPPAAAMTVYHIRDSIYSLT